jgi:hypothetical protein
MLNASCKPTPRLRAASERELLQSRLYHLQDLKAWTLEGVVTDTHATTRAAALQVAIDHLRAAIDALESASQP